LPLTLGLGAMVCLGMNLRASTVVVLPIAFGLAIDDTIHLLARYRHELAQGATVREAVARAIRTSGRAVVLTTLYLVAGYSVLFTSAFQAPIDMAMLFMVVLVAALIGDLLLLPALLIRFGVHDAKAPTPALVVARKGGEAGGSTVAS